MELRLGSVCAFTGHRPEKLPWRYDERDDRCVALKGRIEDAVRTVYEAGARHFICGMAKGCDLYFAETVLSLRDDFPDITLEAAIPCQTQADGWPEELRRRYLYILHQCDRQTVVSREYTPECMFRRNRYMVDSAQVLIAVYDGRPGGTMQTVRYARALGREIVSIVLEEESCGEDAVI